jgi:hypothetical protein
MLSGYALVTPKEGTNLGSCTHGSLGKSFSASLCLIELPSTLPGSRLPAGHLVSVWEESSGVFWAPGMCVGGGEDSSGVFWALEKAWQS